uniref:BMA-DIG-1, isoform e n=1 Tax=Brugia malayi TaxID=6279 RepID=A0A1I9G4K3_BRUMA|nr:BMA-DIG-1, isoform e [Brugia malayi]
MRTPSDYQQSSVVLSTNDTGRCVVSADKASHYCGDIEVTAPPFPPPEAGQCHFSSESSREICWPRYEDLDTTCTDIGNGMVSAPAVKHAAIRAMAFVPPDNLRRLVRQYYRQKGLSVPRNTTFSKNSFLFALYECDDGYEFVDEVNSMFCINRHWVITPPKCRGKGMCEIDNGGCSHSCLSIEDRIECRCPHGLVLGSDQKTCIKPIPKNLCRILNSCSCTAINENQYSCTCPKGEKCLLLRGRPKIYIEPAAPYEITPGGNLNITCSAVSHPFPQIFWQRGDEAVDIAPVKPGTVRSEQILIIKELYKNTQFTCHANNSLGKTERTIEIVVTGPGSAPIIRGIDAGRSSVYVRWDPPVIVNRPVTSYTVYYTNNGNQPIKNWKKVNVEDDISCLSSVVGALVFEEFSDLKGLVFVSFFYIYIEPDREVTIKDLRPNTQYFIRLRANDKLGPGRLSNPVSLNTRRPVRPQLFIQEGDTIYVGPLKRFSISCNVTRGDPSPKIAWYTRARPINKSQRKKFITMEHGGLYESTNFSCVAENDAGRTTKRIQVIVTGPTSPERIRYQIHGNNVDLQWEPPRITNGQLKDYDVLYTDNPKLSDEYWEVVKTGNPDARSLRISNLKEKRDYTFKIRAHNELGPGLFSNQFTLTTWLAARPPIVTITPAEKVVKDPSNEELIFECEAIGVPRPKILWLWSGGLVEDGKNEFRIYDVTPPDAQNRSNSKLIAEKTNRAGVATCQAVNPHGSDEKHTEVKIVGPGSPPRDISTIPFTNDFKVSWNPPKYPNGKIIRYIIYYTKNPDDLLGDWEKTAVGGDQLEVTVSADEDTPYNVRVQAVTKDGPGIISEAYDVTTGKKPVPLSVKLVILDPQVEDGSTETVVEPLKTIIFKCDAKGRPAPQISYTWLPFNETESGQEPISIPAYSDPQEAHRYHSLDVNTNTATKRALMCNARNIDGSESDQHIFNVLKPGSPPENIQAIIDLDNRVTMSWQEPKYPNGPIVKYKVYLTSDPSEPINHWNIYDVEPSEEPRLVLERGKLQPETPYYIKVVAVGEKGEGLQSDIILFETVSGAPIDEPKNVLATVERDNTMDISWTGPSVPNGPIQAYTVYFTPLDQYQTSDDAYKQWDKIVVQSSENFGTLRLNKDIYDILPNKLYRIRVSATNDLSEGPASEPITIRTESGETPPVIHLEPIDNPLTVAPYGSISVRCTATGIPPPIIMWIIGTNASDVIRGPILQLTNLRKDETVTCKAENNAGQAQEVLQILVAGPGTPPNEIVAFPLENQQASIEWTTPDSPNGRITDYIIHYGEVFDGEALPRAWETVHVSAEEPQKHRLVGLKPKTSYAIRLQAMSDRGPGVLSDPIKITTLPLAPAIVQLSDIKVHENNTVAIQFDAPRDPEDPGKPIKEFLIHYTDDDPLSEDAEWKEMFWTEPDDDFSVSIPIGGEHFKPDTKYSIKLIARGEIDSPPSEPIVFQTGDGIVPPEKPQINVDAPDDVIRVPAGSDYTVGCSSTGFPIPRIFWVNKDEQPLSDGPMLRLQDVKETVKAKCVAENEGGRTETPFEIFVTGPGNAPSNIRLNSVRPRTIHIDWDPPTIPNGNITRYIIYYTPLDDQNIVYQMGQIPKKPITEWMTSHKDSEPLIGASQRADLIDFVEPDTAYAVVLQAVNQDGPGPYSEQHTIRTMSRAREGPPLDLKVEPEGQRSANVEWHRPITSEQLPIGYELYYIKADAKIWEDDLASIDDWSMISITEKDEDRLYYKIDGSLEPDTEYVFRMRAVYPDGPGVFSDACITKTLPDGNAPYILISNGEHGVEGKTEITILPGSALDLSCNATGQPRPAVKWIRSGYYPIDPAWVKADEKYAIWFLKVSNITEDTSFNCVAQSPLGFANWTISVRLLSDLRPTWKNDFLVAKNEDGEVAVHFTDDLPDYLKGSQNPWNIYWTDNPSKPFETWNLIPSNGRPLDRIAIPEMEPGAKYHLVIEQPSAGIKTPVFDIMTPKAASDIRVGTDINGETVLDFKPALATEPIKKYIIKYWPDSNPSAVMYMETPVNVTDKIVLDGLQPEIDYNFMVTAKFDDGDNLASEPTKIRTPSEDIQCHCAHACMFEEDEEGMIIASCYCHNGFKLADDKKSCEPIEEDEEGSIVQVTPPTLIPESEHPKELTTMPTLFNDLLSKSEKFDKEMEILEPKELAKIKPSQTDEFGRAIWQDEQLVTTSRESVSDGFSLISTDSSQQDRVLSPVVGFDGAPLPTDEYGRAVDNLRNPIIWDNEGRPIGPNGIPLRRNYKGEYIYPVIGKNGQPLPTDINMKPIYPIVGPDNQPFRKNQEGMHIDQYGQIIPTDTSGRPISVDGSPYPTDEYGRYIVDSENVIQQVVPTDELGRVIYPVFYPDGILLATVDDGRFVNEHGHLIPTNDAGLPVNERDEVLPKDSEGNFVYVGNYILPTDSNGQPVKVQYNGRFLKSDKMGHIIGPNGQLVVVNDYGYPIDESNTVFSTTSDGIFVLPVTDGKGMVVPGTEQKKGVKRLLNIVGPNGHLLPTMEDGTVLDPFGKTIPTNNIGEPVNYRNEPLPTNSEGQAIYPKDGLDCPLPPTDRHGRPVYSVVGPDGRLLPRKYDGAAIDPDGNLLPTNAAGVPVDRKGRPLPSDRNGSIIYPARGISIEPLPTDSNGKPVYPVIGLDGRLLPTNKDARVIDEDGRPLPTNAAGVPVNEQGEPLPFDQNGYIRYPAVERQGKSAYIIIGTDGEPLPRNGDGLVIGPDNKPVPTDASGYPVDHRGRPLPQDRSGNIIYPANGIDAEPMPTDRNGRPMYLVIGPDGQLLPKDSNDVVIDIDGRPIPTNAAGVPLDHYGKPLSVDRNGYVFYPKESYESVRADVPVYAILGPDGVLLKQNADGAIVDPYGRPIPTDSNGYPIDNYGKPLLRDNMGNFIYPAGDLNVGSAPTDASKRPQYFVIGPNGEVLPRGYSGEILDPYGTPIPTNAIGIPVNNQGEPLPRDIQGNFIYPATGLDVKLLPTDRSGKIVYPIVDSHGEPLPTNENGALVDNDGSPIPTNRFGLPVDEHGNFLPKDIKGNFIFGTPIKPTDHSGLPVYPVIGPDGKLLPQDKDGNVVDPAGRPIPTNDDGVPVDNKGQPLPSDKTGVVIFPANGLDAEPMPTDKSGKPVYSVIGPDGHPLPITADHKIIGPDGNIVPVNAAGVPTNHRGEPLPRDRQGNFIYPATGLDVKLLPTDRSGKIVYPIVDSHGEPLPTNENGALVDNDGSPIPTNRFGLPVDEHGNFLPKDIKGNFIFGTPIKPTDHSGLPVYPVIGPDGKLLPQDKDGNVVDPAGRPIPTNDDGVPVDNKGQPLPSDKTGVVIFPANGLDAEPMPTDKSGKPVYSVIGPDGHPLPITADHKIIGPDGNIVPVNAAGVPTNHRGEPLPRDRQGNFIYPATGLDVKLLPTDRSGKIVYPIVDSHGEPLPTNENGAFVNNDGSPIPTNRFGLPVDEHGKSLPKDVKGNFIFGTPIEPTDHRGLLYPIIGPSGELLPTEESGNVIGPDGHAISVDNEGRPINNRGETLPSDRFGNFIYPLGGLDAELLPTDSNGLPIYRVIDSDGQMLPTNDRGLSINGQGKSLPTNAAGVPVDDHGKPLPIDSNGNLIYRKDAQKSLSTDQGIYPVIGPDEELLPADKIGVVDGQPSPADESPVPVYPVIGPNGELLPTAEGGLVIGLDGSPLSTNAAGKPVGPDASLLPTDEVGRVIHLPPEEPLSTFATNEYGHIVHPVVDMAGKPLDKDDTGAHITKNGIPVELNENYLPVDPDGNILPTDSQGNYIFPDLDIMGRILPTDKTSQTLYPLTGRNGQLLDTDSNGATSRPDGELGKPVRPDGKPLPTDEEGLFIHTEVIGTHPTKKVVNIEGRPLPTDELGRYLLAPNFPVRQDDSGRLIGPDGQPLPTDDSGNYVYREKMKYPSDAEDDFGHPLPTNEDGFYVRRNDSMITTESVGLMMDGQGVILPTDERGILIVPELPTQTKSYQVLDEQNQILPTDEAGNFLYHNGYPIAENEEGKPISPDGIVLPTTDTGYYVFATTRQKPMIPSQKGTDHYPLPTDQFGMSMMTSSSVQGIYGMDGELLPIDRQLINEEGEEARLGEKVRFSEPAEGILSTDEYGKYIYPALKPNGKLYPTDRGYRPVYPVIGYDGELLPTNDEGLALNFEGHPIPTNNIGRPLDEDGIMLPMDSKGNVVYDTGKKNCDTHRGIMDITVVINVEILDRDSFDHVKKVIQNLVIEHFDLSPDVTQFALVKYAGTAEVPITLGGYNEKMELLEELSRVKIDHIKEHPRLIVGVSAAKQQFVSFGREDAGKLMIVITNGQDIYSEDRFKDNIIPMLVVGSKEFEEEIKDWTKSYILVDSWKQLHADSIANMIEKECLLGRIFIPTKKVSSRSKSERFEDFTGSSLTTDEFGRIVVLPTSERVILSTDEYGHVAYSVKDTSGRLLPINGNGLVMDRELVESDYSKPIASNRRQLPTDESEAFIYSAGGKDKALSPDSKKGWNTSIDEKPLSTNQDGLSLDINGQSIVTNLAGKYSSQGSPYSFNGNDNIIMSKRTEKITDATDYPVIDPDNILLSRDPSDFYINNIERVVERDDSGKLLGSVEKMMPSDAGGFTYRKHSQGGKLPRSDSNISTAKNDGFIVDTSFHKRLPYTLSNNKVSDEHNQVSFEEPEAIAETRNFINNQNSPLPIEVDQAGKPVVKVEPFPTNKYGDSIYAGGSMVSTSASEQAIGPDDSLMSVDYRGRDVSDYIPDRTGLGETKLLAKVSTCNKVEKSVNIIFMVESSNATGTNLNKIKFSLLNFIKKNINWNIAKVGIVSYGSTMNVNLNVGNYQSYDDLKKSILSLSLIGGSSSGDEHAFRTALQLFREKYNNDSGELIMHVFKTPLSKDAQIIADHLKMNETISILSLGSDQWYRLENDKEIKKLRSNMCLLLMKSHLARTRKPSDSDGGTVRSDRFGRPLDTYALSLPTDEREGVKVLPTNERGQYAKQITVNEDKTIAPDGKIISADGGKQHIYQTFASENRHRSTNSHRKLIYQIFGDDRRILPTDQTGARFKVDGKSGVTNFYGEPLNSERSSIFSTDTSEGYHISTKKLTENKRNSSLLYPATDSNLKTIADTFVSATSVSLPFLILFPDGRALSIGENGAYLDDNGQSLVHIDQSGHPIISANGTPLQKIGNGKYLYPYESQKEKPTFANVGDEDHLLRTDSGGRQIQLNDRERSGYGRSSPEDERGSYVETTLAYHASTSSGIDTWTSSSSYCVVSSNVDMLLILDSSSSVRVVDYRIMKDFIKKFLTNHFNLQRNYVRVGVMKYGDKVEIPISLGDYDSQTELLSRISETRRMRGNANLGQALLDASGEFLIFGSKDIPRIIIIFSNGRSRGELKENALLLRNDTKVHIFLVDVGNQGDKAQNLAIVGESNPHRIIAIDGWHAMRPDILNPFVNELCKLLPQKQDKASRDSTWPTRQTEMRIATPIRICNRVDFQADIIFVLDSSDNVTSKEYVNLKEDISMLIDDIFDLSPDIVRIGFIEYSDKASVPVPLGYYDNKVQLLADISNSEQLGGTPVIVRGLHAAKEQFKRHGRNGVSRILLLVTSGANRGNVATAADDLRKRLKVSVFALVVNTSRGAQMMLNRLTGDEHTQRRVISISSASKLQERELLHIGQVLCGDSDVIPATIWPAQETPHRTTKRDVSYGDSKRKKDKISRSSLLYWKTTTATEHVAPKPLCKDGLLRPYQISIVVDNTARSPEKDFRLVLNHIVSFLKMRFSPESKLVQLNLVGVGSDGTNLKAADFGVDVADKIFAKLIQKKSDEISPKLGRGLDEAMLLAKEHAVKGVIQIILIISADGTSSDDAIQSAQNAREQYVDGIVAISIRAPSSELLKELSLGSSTKVIHFPDWSIGNELFQSWISHAFCSYVSTSITRKIKLTRMTRPPIRKTSKISMNDATNVEVTPLSPNSLLVSWTCCTNNKADYIISYTSDLSLPKEYWHKLNATCRDSFGRKIDGLPSGTYSVCVETLQRYINKSVPFNTDECETIKIDSDTTAPPDQKLPNSQSTVQCQCICANNGKAFVKPTCGTLMDPFRPVATLPPAIDGECHCSIPSKGGRCPSGYFFDRGQCYDVDECEQQNGGCSHGCVNTPGDFYCACPHGMMRDPADLKMCISVASSFDRIAALFGQYLHANQYNANATSNEKSDAQTDGKVVRYKATVKSEDDKTISFEWSLMPAVVRKAFKWLF